MKNTHTHKQNEKYEMEIDFQCNIIYTLYTCMLMYDKYFIYKDVILQVM